MNNEQKWINDISKHAGDFKRKAPEGLLDDIKLEMSRRGVMPSRKQQRPRLALVWTRRIAAAAAAVLLAVLILRNLSDSGSNLPSASNIIAPGTHAPENSPIAERTANDNGVQANGHVVSTESTSGVPSFVANIINKVVDDGKTFIAQLTDGTQAVAPQQSLIADNDQTTMSFREAPESPQAAAQQQNIPSAQQRKKLHNWYSNSALSEGFAPTTKSGNRFSVAMNYSGMGSSSAGTGVPLYNLNSESMPINDNINVQGYSSLAKAPSAMETTAHHDMPVKLGINLRYNIGSRWSLQTGFNYSYLSSDITRDNNMEEYKSRQKLHYVSVPVTASYSVWSNKHVNVYLSAGAEAGKLVKGKADVEHVVYNDNNDVTTSSETVHEHRMQYSVSGAAGIEYKAGNCISLYAEPGVTRYLDNHSSVVNIYKDKPTQFTINVGLRINLNKK